MAGDAGHPQLAGTCSLCLLKQYIKTMKTTTKPIAKQTIKSKIAEMAELNKDTGIPCWRRLTACAK